MTKDVAANDELNNLYGGDKLGHQAMSVDMKGSNAKIAKRMRISNYKKYKLTST